MEPQRELAIVLKVVPFQDRHRIVTAITENHGKITALARNSVQSRRFGGTLEPFAASLWHMTLSPGAELWTLTQAESRRSYEGLRKSFELLALASTFNELLLRMAPQNQAAPELLKLHANALAAVEESGKPELCYLNAYLAKVLQWGGCQPRAGVCKTCDRALADLSMDESLSCLVEDAAWLCPNCRPTQTKHLQAGVASAGGLRISAAAMRDLEGFLHVPIRQVPLHAHAGEKGARELLEYLEKLCAYHLPGLDRTPLKSLAFLR